MDQVDSVAALMEEFRLSEASLTVDGFRIAFRRSPTAPVVVASGVATEVHEEADAEETVSVSPPVAAVGIPITSPMNGIFYNSPNPSSPPFAKVGELVSEGQIIGLIEAMKVFNEIPSPFAGTVRELVAESGAVVQPGDVLIRIEP